MGQLSAKLRSLGNGHVAYWCQGCGGPHVVRVEGEDRPRWSYDGNAEAPTFEPSVLVRTGRAVDSNYQPEEGDPPEICHTFIRGGMVQFLSDCTHRFAGQTLPLPDWPEGQDEAEADPC